MFDETTIEEIAQAAGISRRSFFRYFASKDDLLAQNVLDYGSALTAAIEACPQGISNFEVIEKTVAAGVQYSVTNSDRTLQIIEIAARSTSARQAHMSRLMFVEDSMSEAFAKRLKDSRRDDPEPRLLAGLTLVLMNTTSLTWFLGDHKDPSMSTRHVFRMLLRTVGERNAGMASHREAAPKGKRARSK